MFHNDSIITDILLGNETMQKNMGEEFMDLPVETLEIVVPSETADSAGSADEEHALLMNCGCVV